jgi:hypothetical protein
LQPKDQLEIERLGGFAGIGLPGSHIRSRALLTGSQLSADERKSVAALFDARSGGGVPAQAGTDAFRYRLTLRSNDIHRVIDVGEADLLESLRARLQDELI